MFPSASSIQCRFFEEVTPLLRVFNEVATPASAVFRRGYAPQVGPVVLTADLVLLLGSEVVLDVERLADLLGRLVLDHVGDGLATGIEERILKFVKVERAILYVPLLDTGGCLARVGVVVVVGLTNFPALGARDENVFRRFAFDHVGDCLAANVEESLDVRVVGGGDDLEEHLLVDLHEPLV